MKTSDVPERILHFNQGRHPEMLRMKLEGLRQPAAQAVFEWTRQIAGMGSLGIDRYVALIEGSGSPNDNYLLDLKEARPSALAPLIRKLGLPQPDWPTEAARIIAVEERALSTPPALLAAVEFAGKSFSVRELEPTQDRIDLASCGGDLKNMGPILETMGELTAWSQLRGGGRQGSATADELIAFAERPQCRQDLLRAAQDYHDRVVADYQAYCEAYDRGIVGTIS